ncbi:MAG: S-adenosylmethionine:tRNA ribosyltransferase-isomerase, partial [Candidatus Moraniibacteriota bacterium]
MIDLEKYNYTLPEELIRKEGVEPRDSARLFVYDTATDTVTFDVFRNVAQYLQESSLMVLNNTRVLPARLWLKKETGGKIEVFVLANEVEDENHMPVLVDRKTGVGQKLFFPNGDCFEVLDQNENIFFVKIVSAQNLSLGDLLEKYGETPLPHYLEGADTKEDVLRKRYQTVFAKDGASVAAPTASLHFTEEVFQSLEEKHIETDFLTLNVGLGTFAPLSDENFETKKLHTEFIDVSKGVANHINMAIAEKRNIIAVGTTALRTLES